MTRNERLAIWREKNREKLREYHREYQRKRRAQDPETAREEWRVAAAKRKAKNPDLVRQEGRDFYRKKAALKPDHVLEKARIQRERHREKIREIARKWAKLNPDKKRAAVAARRAALIKAVPSWVDKKAIEQIYQTCHEVTMKTGLAHHVDHIVPLRGKTVSGLHVPWNLQVIPAIENARKSNKWGP